MIIDRDRAEMFAGWFRCLADPTRMQILSLLASERRPMTVGEIVAAMDVRPVDRFRTPAPVGRNVLRPTSSTGHSSLFLVNEQLHRAACRRRPSS